MRSRYTAYVRRNVDYLVHTHAPTFGTVDRESIRAWAGTAEWLGLEIVSTSRGLAGDSYGEVEFKARYKAHGSEGVLHERSRFVVQQGQWAYVDGDVHGS